MGPPRAVCARTTRSPPFSPHTTRATAAVSNTAAPSTIFQLRSMIVSSLNSARPQDLTGPSTCFPNSESVGPNVSLAGRVAIWSILGSHPAPRGYNEKSSTKQSRRLAEIQKVAKKCAKEELVALPGGDHL